MPQEIIDTTDDDHENQVNWVTLGDIYILILGCRFPLSRRDDDDWWSTVGGPDVWITCWAMEHLYGIGFLQPNAGHLGRGGHRHGFNVLEEFDEVGVVETSAAGKRLLSVVSSVMLDFVMWWSQLGHEDQAEDQAPVRSWKRR
jgi:hypothetical protein